MVLLVPLMVFVAVYAQNLGKPSVGFVVDRSILAASVRDEGNDGLTHLADIFTSLGANVTVVRVGQPIPDEVDVVVLANPLNELTIRHTAHLWSHMARGGHLLIAFDPNGFSNVKSETAAGGLNQLLTQEYGSSLQDSFLIEPWFTSTTFLDLANTQSLAFGEDIIAHPIIKPLVEFGLPIHLWGARSIAVDSFGPGSSATPLIVSDTAYGETGNIFSQLEPDPVRINIGADYLSRVLIGGIGINEEVGSRMVLLGDSELLQNGFGLSQVFNTTDPRFIGNYVLMQRIAAWLLELPEDEWPPLPAGFTWLNIDGDASDWDKDLPVSEDVSGDTTNMAYDLRNVTAFHNDNYLYVSVETVQAPQKDTQVELEIEKDREQRVRIILSADQEAVITLDDEPIQLSITDVAMVVGDVIEIRLPLRIVGLAPTIKQLCLASAGETLDCSDRRLVPLVSEERDPSPLYIKGVPLAVVSANIPINLRLGPGENYPAVDRVFNGDVFLAVGKSPDGQWINVENGRYSAWISSSWLAVGGDVSGESLLEAPPVPDLLVPQEVCTIISFADINKRSGPGVRFDLVGQAEFDERFEAISRATAPDGYIWWQLEDESWVRSDVVVETGNCDDLPEITPLSDG
jgi:hypothetical protein